MTILPPLSPTLQSRLHMKKAQGFTDLLYSYGAVCVAVVGSTARGTATEVSDLDLLVIGDKHFKESFPNESGRRVAQPVNAYGSSELMAVGDLPSRSGHYILTFPHLIEKILRANSRISASEFSIMKLIADGICLSADKDYANYWQELKDGVAARLHEGPTNFSPIQYESAKFDLHSLLRDQFDPFIILERINKFLFRSLGLWQHGTTTQDAIIKHNKSVLPKKLSDLTYYIGLVSDQIHSLKEPHSRSSSFDDYRFAYPINAKFSRENKQIVQHKMAELIKNVIAFTDQWRQAPHSLSANNIRLNPRTLKDFGL